MLDVNEASTMATRINVLFPDDVLHQLRDLVPEGKRSHFIIESTRDRLLRERQRRALEVGAGAWDDPSQAHLDTAGGIKAYLDELGEEDAEREAYLEDLRGSLTRRQGLREPVSGNWSQEPVASGTAR
jgi:hypothetical protein